MPNLLNLSTELHSIIIDHLDFPSLSCLRYTSRHFYNLPTDTQIQNSLIGIWYEVDKMHEYQLSMCLGCALVEYGVEEADPVYSWSRIKGKASKWVVYCLECGENSREQKPPNKKQEEASLCHDCWSEVRAESVREE